MLKNNRLLRTVTEIIIVTVPLFLRALGFVKGSGTVNYVFYAFSSLGALWIAADTLSVKTYSSVFSFGKSSGMGIMSYVLSFGLFLDFISSGISLALMLAGGGFVAGVAVFTKCFTSVLALLSSAYFITVGLTFSDGRYDFRYLKLLHLAPMGWIAGRLLEMLIDAGITSADDISAVLEYIVLALSMCFFYSLAREVENEGGARRSTVMLSFELAYFSILYSYSRIIEIIRARFEGVNQDALFTVTAVTLSLFCFFFYRNIVSETNKTEN